MAQGSFDINKMKKMMDQLEQKLRQIPQLQKLHKTIGVPVTYVLIAAVACAFFFIYLFSGMRAITNMVAFVYPAYMTVKAIDSKDKQDDTLWLAYWLFYGLFTVVESVTDVLLFWIPMYEVIKMVFYIYLYAPQMQGAIMLYRRLIHPWVDVLKRYEQSVTKSMGQVGSVFQDATAASAASKTKGSNGSGKRK